MTLAFKYCPSKESEADSPMSIYRFSRDRPRFTDTLDIIKFLCKDLWTLVFRKQIDNLKTNHRVHPSVLYGAKRRLIEPSQGVYVLTDHAFRPFARMSMSSRSEAVEKAQPV